MEAGAITSWQSSCRHWLTDRWFLAALLVQLVNDQVLKPWIGPGPLGLITSKVSDFTAPLVGSVLIAVILAALPEVVSITATSVRVQHVISLSIPALVLIGINVSATAAAWYEHTLAAITGVSHQVVVDPTDLIGLLVLPLVWRVLTRPAPVAVPIIRVRPRLQPWITALLGGLAMLVTVANSVSEYSPRSELTERDSVLYAHSPTGSDVRASIDDGESWDWYWNLDLTLPGDLSVDDPDTTVNRTSRHCLQREPSTCVRIAGQVTVEESVDEGETWTVAWHLDDTLAKNLRSDSHGYQEYSGDILLTDIHETESGSVLVAAGNLDPIRRSPTGQWTPTVTDLRSIPLFALIVITIVVAVLALLISLVRVNPLWGGLLMAGVVATTIGLPLLFSFIGTSPTLSAMMDPIAGVVRIATGLWLPVALVLVLVSGHQGRRILGRNLLIATAAGALGFAIWWGWAATGVGSYTAAWTVVGTLFVVAVVVMLLPDRFFPTGVANA